ncbi:hypothetical protein XM47_15880 [Catenovulum maritimum]|uniref:N-acetyltransferase domain-containing protein n=1 Tax=Catenovulum maritimum TaxID=1513271 RepID=A0A0J8JI89_9ALTE|nr:hypothetical protein XM47_15880 [Catenovulum maritimum]
MNIRPECYHDVAIIETVTIAAFKNHPHSNQTEHKIVSGLRTGSALSISLVAEFNGTVIGHIAFSKVKINNEFIDWYGLAPVSVIPEFQNQGIGSQLINAGLKALQELGALGCVLLGEPEYYTRFGFKSEPQLILNEVPPEYFLSLVISGDMPSGVVSYHQAFSL